MRWPLLNSSPRREKPFAFSAEPLEARVAPASVLVFTDVDGDKVKITSSVGDLNAAGVADLANAGLGQQLRVLTLTDASFEGAVLKTSVTKAARGDGLVNIGYINATGLDLKSIAIKGDLGSLDVGDADQTDGSLKLLSVRSVGTMGLATQGGVGDLELTFQGTVDRIVVAKDIRDAHIAVPGGNDALARINFMMVGGSVFGGALNDSGTIGAGQIGTLIIAKDVVGGSGTNTSIIFGNSLIESVRVGGSLLGGAGGGGASILSFGNVGRVTIGHDVVNAGGAGAGQIFAQGTFDALTIGGSVTSLSLNPLTLASNAGQPHVKVGGDVSARVTLAFPGVASLAVRGNVVGSLVFAFADSGLIKIGGSLLGMLNANNVANITIGGDLGGGGTSGAGKISATRLGSVKIGGSILGDLSSGSGSITAAESITSLDIRGSVLGASGNGSGFISAGGEIGSIRIGGDLRGSGARLAESVNGSGAILADRIGSFFLGGSLVAGQDNSSGTVTNSGAIRVNHDIGSVTIRGDMLGANSVSGVTPAIISARGQASLETDAANDIAIGSIKIGGRVQWAKILAGFDQNDTDSAGTNSNASIGTVSVGGDWIASSISAGIQDVDGNGFASGDDVPIPGPADNLIAQIANMTIRGSVTTPVDGSFGFTAQHIGAFRAAGISFPLTPGADFLPLSFSTPGISLRDFGL